MPWLPIPEDHCRTAADVREQRRHVIAMRMACVEKTPPPAPAIQPVPAQPCSEEERKINEVIAFACTRFNASRAMLLGNSRSNDCLHPRHTAVYLLRAVLYHNWRKIGAAVHRSDTVVISSFHRAERLLIAEPEHPVSTAIREGLRRFAPLPPVPPPPPIELTQERQAKNKPESREFKPEEPGRLSALSDVARIVDLTARYFRIELAVLKGERRTSFLVTARHVAGYLCCTCTSRSTLEIGDIMKRDHTSILHGCRRVIVKIRNGDHEITTAVDHLRDVIKGTAPLTPMNLTDFVSRTRYRTEFTKEEMDLIREMWAAGASYRDIGHRLGRTELSIDSKMKRMRELDAGKAIAKKYGIDFTKDDEDRIRQLYFAGKSYKEIATATSRTVNSIAKKLQRMEIQRRGPSSNAAVESSPAVLHP